MKPSQKDIDRSAAISGQKKCPDCAEYVSVEAKKCRYCGKEFTEEEIASAQKTLNKRKGIMNRSLLDGKIGATVSYIVLVLLLIFLFRLVQFYISVR